MAPSATQSLGSRRESDALEYLRNNGLHLVEKNFRSRFGEIDLVMTDQQMLVFVEVRFRSPNHYYSAAQSVGPAKQRKLILTAETFLKARKHYANAVCRFDVVAIEHPIGSQTTIQWIKDAFRPGEW